MHNSTRTSSPAVLRFTTASILLFLVAVLFASCEDIITPVALEDVRVAALPVRKLTMQPASDGTASPAAGDLEVKDGEPLSISATANAGFEFLFWEKVSGTGTVIFDDASSPDTIVRVTGGDAVIKARIDDTNYTITITAQTGGAVTPSALNLDKGIESTGTIVAIPSSGYSFAGWTVSAGSSTGITFNPSASTASTKIIANSGDSTIQANFNDTQIPTGTVAIQGELLVDGTTYYSKTKAVTVNLTANDNSGVVSSVKLSTTTFATGTTSGWIPMDLSTVYNFPSDGAKTLYVRFKDSTGNESNVYTDSTIVDSTAPVPSRYQLELTNNPNIFPLYVTTYNSNLQLNYLASDAGSGVKSVYFSRTTTRPPIAQVTPYPATPVPFTWSIADDLYTHNYYNVNFWFEDKLGNISSMYTDPVRYDDRYEYGKGNNTFGELDALSGATIDIYSYGGATTWSFNYGSSGYSYLVDPDFYRWALLAMESNNTYPVEIIIDVNAAGQMPDVTFYDHEREPIETGVTRVSPYLGSNNKAQYTFNLPFFDTYPYYYNFYMQVQKTDGINPLPAPYAQRPDYTIWWTFNEDQGM